MTSSSLPRFVLTGATGLLGRCVAAKAVASGHDVLALARPSSDTSTLEKMGVSVARGTLTDQAFLNANLACADVFVNCAAKITNWGSWSEFEQANIHSAKALVAACDQNYVKRVIHISSIAVYGHPKTGGLEITEDDNVGQKLLSFDYYNQSKIAAEQIFRTLGDATTILRPTWFIGPGDKVIVPAFIRKLQKGKLWILGAGDNLLNGLAVEDVADGVILAAAVEAAGGQTFNLCSSGEMTQREFMDTICDTISIPRVTRSVPLSVVKKYAWLVENIARVCRSAERPPLTRHDLSVFTRPVCFSNHNARVVMHWKPRVALKDALLSTIEWWQGTESNGTEPPPPPLIAKVSAH